MDAKEILFDEYIERVAAADTDREANKVSASIEQLLSEGKFDSKELGELLGEYELAAKKSGFYAGLKAGLDLMK